MIIRLKGGLKGVAEYLKTGRKKGRTQSRDELDQRVVLLGDLDAMHQTITTLAKGREKYLHFTLSFREDEVPLETLRGVAESFQTFITSAYRPGELMCYAEAHLPRIKTLKDQGTDEVIDRFAHIHFIVPKLNLLTAKAADPLGRVSRQIRYIDAFQEWANDFYGLASPKDSRRTGFQSGADILSRHNGDHFTGANKELKQKILDAIVSEGISSFAGLGRFLATLGEVRTRNADRSDAYYNIKIPGDSKGTNLKEVMFTEAFLQLSPSEKQAMLLKSHQPNTFVSVGEPRVPGVERPRLIQEWHALRSKEVKYLNSGNKSQWASYYSLNEEGKMKFIAGLEAKYYAKIDNVPSMDPEPMPGFSGPSEPTQLAPLFLHASDNSLGERIRQEVDSSLDTVYLPKLATTKRDFPMDWVEKDLREKYGLPLKKFRPQLELAHQAGTSGLYQFLRRQMNLAPNVAWVHLVQWGLVQSTQLSTPRRAVSDQLWQEYLQRKKRLEVIAEAADRKSALAVLQMSLVLSRKYLWAQNQETFARTQESEKRDLLTRAFSGTEEPEKPFEPEQDFHLSEWAHRKTESGHVEYLRKETTVIRDEIKRVVLLETDAQMIELGLRLAVLKFGPKIRVIGPDDFRKKTVLVASRMKLEIGFLDQELQQELEKLRHVQNQKNSEFSF